MIRKTLAAAALLLASTGAFATGFGHVEARVLDVAPRLSLSFGSLIHDGFNVTYELGGSRYVTHRYDRPGRVIYVPQPVRVTHVHRYENRHRHWNRWDDHDRGRRAWQEHNRFDDRKSWKRHDRDDDRRGSRR